MKQLKEKLIKNVLLITVVYLEKTNSINMADVDTRNFNLAAIKQQGYTAIIGYRVQSGGEIIIFNSNQVKNIKYTYGTRPQAVFSTASETHVFRNKQISLKANSSKTKNTKN